MLEFIKVPTATVFLTLLIWGLADQLATEILEITVPIQVREAPGSGLVVSQFNGTPRTITVRLAGRQRDIIAIRESRRNPIVIELDANRIKNRALNPFELSLIEELNSRKSNFRGCTIESVEPGILHLNVDRVETREIPIRVKPGQIQYTVSPRVEPTSVLVDILGSAFERIADAQPHILVDADTFLRDQPEDVALKLPIPLDPVIQTERGQIPARSLTPDAVTLRATLRQRVDYGTLQAVPIKLQTSPNIFNNFKIEFRVPNPAETLTVKISGPLEMINRLTSGERKTFAIINIGSTDTLNQAKYQFFRPELNLPPGVTLAEGETLPAFEIRVVPREIANPERAHAP